MEKTTLNRLFKEGFDKNADRPSLGWKIDGEYRYISYEVLDTRVTNFAAGLIDLGIQPGETVALLSENRYEWAVSDLATLRAGAVTVPMFATLPAKQVEYIVRDSGARILIVSSKEQVEKAVEVKHEIPSLERVIVMDEDMNIGSHVWAMRWKDVLDSGANSDKGREEAAKRQDAVRSDDLASIIYTSGTTGEPKGAMLTHNNFASNAIACAKAFELTPDDAFLSFLPLAHVFERLAGHYLPLSVGACIAYTESLRTLANNLQEARPTIFLGVPRLWEMLMERIQGRRKQLKGLQRSIFDNALRVAEKVAKAKLNGNPVSAWDSALYAVYDALVYRKIRGHLGGQLRLGGAGGAPLPPAVCEFFYGIGILLLEGYGLTETSPVISVNRPPMPKIGTVGPLIEGVEVKIEEDGEILSRGPHIMRGYWNKPDETKEAIDPEGWFHTGDIGTFVENCLKITDRKKNILVLANGKNVAPALVENTVLRSPYIAQIVVLGDRQKTVSALIVPNFEAIKEWATSNGLGQKEAIDLVNDPQATRLIREEIDRLSGDLADFERIHRFTLLPKEFSVEGGELTPTLKIKRKVVEDKYRDEISEMND